MAFSDILVLNFVARILARTNINISNRHTQYVLTYHTQLLP